jgi:hypothetical protein
MALFQYFGMSRRNQSSQSRRSGDSGIRLISTHCKNKTRPKIKPTTHNSGEIISIDQIMKTQKNTTPSTSGFNPQRPSASLRRVRFRSTWFAVLVAIIALLGSALTFRAKASSFPSGPENENTHSMGVFRIVVDSGVYSLLNQGTAVHAYPGWNGTELTSPLLNDYNFNPETSIGVSGAYIRPNSFSPSVAVGLTGVNGAGISVTEDDISSYSTPPSFGGSINCAGYAYPDFSWLAGGCREILTEIQSFGLYSVSNCVYPGTLVPSTSFGQQMVKAGWDAGVPLRSIGMVQSQDYTGATDFPARSFFNVFVEVTLPYDPTTMMPPGGAVLTNACDDPLIIVNSNIPDTGTSGQPPLPPQVVYIHQNPMAVELYFRDNNPPYWTKGQHFGSLVLAGHGLLNPCGKSNVGDFLQQVLGTVGQSALEAPVGHAFLNETFPSPNGAYNSIQGTNFGGLSLDAVNYTNGGVLTVRSFSIRNFPSPILLPTVNSSDTYTNPNTLVTMQMSFDGISFFSAQATGQVSMVISNGNDVTGNITSYDTELLALNLTGSTVQFGSFKIRESPTKASLGKHLVKETAGGSVIAGYFDFSSELSVNNGETWAAANRPIRVKLETTCGAAGAQLSITRTNSAVRISWADSSYRLQSRQSLLPGIAWSDVPGSSPVILQTTNTGFYRLICP